MILISVDLPAPFSPIRAWTLPGCSVRSTFSRAITPGKRLSMPRISSAGIVWSIVSALSPACRISAGIGSVPHDVEIARHDDDDAGNHHLQILVPAKDDDAVVDDLEHQDAKKRADDRAAPAEKRRAAENDGSDH